MLGRQAVQSEVQERERLKEEIGGVKEWLMAAVSLLSVMEDLPSTQDLQVGGLREQDCAAPL